VRPSGSIKPRVRQFVDELLDADPDANIIGLGDPNDFWFSPPLATITTGATPGRTLLDLMMTLHPRSAMATSSRATPRT
jgi:predicted extracellular nuclease